MGTQTITISEEAYERLETEKKEGESFSDLIRRLIPNVWLQDFHGALSEETADELEEHYQRGVFDDFQPGEPEEPTDTVAEHDSFDTE